MPIIALKDNPPSQLHKKPILETVGTWWIAKVKPQQEKAFAFDLIEREIEYYLPFCTKFSKRSDGKLRKSILVLFPSYVPIMIENPYTLLNTNRIVTFLPVESQRKFIVQLNNVWIANNAGMDINPVHGSFQIGEFVKIISGPMNGTLGHVIKNQGTTSILLRVDGLGCVNVSVNLSQIRKDVICL
jgi:transcription antitermination factor NusG